VVIKHLVIIKNSRNLYDIVDMRTARIKVWKDVKPNAKWNEYYRQQCEERKPR
jgi:hypothetical protein